MPCRLATPATGSRSASRMIATICSSVKRALRIAPSESGASLSRNQWSEIPRAGQAQVRHSRPDLGETIPTRRWNRQSGYGALVRQPPKPHDEMKVGKSRAGRRRVPSARRVLGTRSESASDRKTDPPLLVLHERPDRDRDHFHRGRALRCSLVVQGAAPRWDPFLVAVYSAVILWPLACHART